MTILETVREHIKRAMKAGVTADIKKNILRQVVSEAQRLDVHTNEEIYKIIRKLVEGNLETLRLGGENARLMEENQILELYLPRVLSIYEIRGSLRAVAEEIRAAKSDGQATGIAMKHMKSQGATVNGKDVGEIVKEIRAQS